MTAGLLLHAITVAFGDTEVVSDFTLEVQPGEVVALVGPSGCGKSTLLRTVAGLQTGHTGTVSWNGAVWNGLPPHQRDIGLMFQDHALFAHRTVGENVAFGLRMRGVPKPAQDERVQELLDLVDLPGFEPRSIDSLSGGEGQRVALARALAPRPAVLLLDEPLGALDRALRESLTRELHGLLREVGQTAIHVTHDQDEAFAIADRVAIMGAGQLHRIDAPERVWNDPQSLFAAGFLGHPTMTVSGALHAVPPGAVALAPAGTTDGLLGVVQASRFQGDRYALDVETEESTLVVYAQHHIELGSEIGLVVDLDRCGLILRP